MINGIPKNEIIWVRRLTENGEVYYITSKESRDYYYLYKINNDFDSSNTPLKPGFNFRSYGEAYQILLNGTTDSERYVSAVELIFGKDELKEMNKSINLSTIKEKVLKCLSAVKLGKSKSPMELEDKYIGGWNCD